MYPNQLFPAHNCSSGSSNSETRKYDRKEYQQEINQREMHDHQISRELNGPTRSYNRSSQNHRNPSFISSNSTQRMTSFVQRPLSRIAPPPLPVAYKSSNYTLQPGLDNSANKNVVFQPPQPFPSSSSDRPKVSLENYFGNFFCPQLLYTMFIYLYSYYMIIGPSTNQNNGMVAIITSYTHLSQNTCSPEEFAYIQV